MSIFQVVWSLKMSTDKQVLAIKYRPQVFEELVGQNIIVEAIQKSISLDKIPNAYLFTGIRGIGKTTTARLIAKALNCEKNYNPKQKCSSEEFCSTCAEIINSNHITANN